MAELRMRFQVFIIPPFIIPPFFSPSPLRRSRRLPPLRNRLNHGFRIPPNSVDQIRRHAVLKAESHEIETRLARHHTNPTGADAPPALPRPFSPFSPFEVFARSRERPATSNRIPRTGHAHPLRLARHHPQRCVGVVATSKRSATVLPCRPLPIHLTTCNPLTRLRRGRNAPIDGGSKSPKSRLPRGT